jgi:hypothetical protein
MSKEKKKAGFMYPCKSALQFHETITNPAEGEIHSILNAFP